MENIDNFKDFNLEDIRPLRWMKDRETKRRVWRRTERGVRKREREREKEMMKMGEKNKYCLKKNGREACPLSKDLPATISHTLLGVRGMLRERDELDID